MEISMAIELLSYIMEIKIILYLENIDIRKITSLNSEV
jgi:hypothetical protein